MATMLKPTEKVSEVTAPPSRFRKFARRSALLAPGTFWPALVFPSGQLDMFLTPMTWLNLLLEYDRRNTALHKHPSLLLI